MGEDQKIYVPGYTDRKAIDEENGIVDAMVSVKELDRDREVVLPSAFKGPGIRDFMKNPVTFLFHRSWGFPCGKALKVDIQDKGIRGTTQFALEIPGTVGDEIRAAWEMVVQGFMNALSIGFWADEWQTDPEEMAKLLPDLQRGQLAAVRRVLVRGRLAEWSFVGIPSSPSSLVERMVKGEIPDEALKDAPAEYREVMEFARKFDWRKDAALREWCGDHQLEVEEFEKGSTIVVPRGYIRTDVELCDADAERVRKQWEDAVAAGKTPVLDSGAEFVPLEDAAAKLMDEMVRRSAPYEPRSPASPYFTERNGATWLEAPLDDDPMGEKLSIPLESDEAPDTDSLSESQREKLAAVAGQLAKGAKIVADLLNATEPEGEADEEKLATECVAALEDIGILTEAAGATPGSQSGGPGGTSR